MADLTLPASAAAAAAARALVAEFCRQHGLDGPIADDAVLITSELVGNAWLHARSGTRLQLDYQQEVLHVAISDSSTRLPVLMDNPELNRNGRGVLILDALAHRWGVDEMPGGKSVWFELMG